VVKIKAVMSKRATVEEDVECVGCNRLFSKDSELLIYIFPDGSKTYWCDVCIEYYNKYMHKEMFLNGELKKNDEDRWENLRSKIEGKGVV